MNGPALLALQRIDTSLDAIANRRARLPESTALAAASAALQAHRAAIAAAQQRAADAQAVIDGTEHDSEALTAKRTRLEGQLKTVIAPREAEALMHEIATINAQRSDLDDRELEALEQQAAAEEEAASLAAGESALVDAEAEATAALDAVVATLDGEQSDLRARRVEAAAAFDAGELQQYDSMRKRHDGVAIAVLDGLRCTGCHLDLSRAEVDQLKALPAGEVADCPQCGRWLAR